MQGVFCCEVLLSYVGELNQLSAFVLVFILKYVKQLKGGYALRTEDCCGFV